MSSSTGFYKNSSMFTRLKIFIANTFWSEATQIKHMASVFNGIVARLDGSNLQFMFTQSAQLVMMDKVSEKLVALAELKDHGYTAHILFNSLNEVSELTNSIEEAYCAQVQGGVQVSAVELALNKAIPMILMGEAARKYYESFTAPTDRSVDLSVVTNKTIN